jgi:hypothetical protein
MLFPFDCDNLFIVPIRLSTIFQLILSCTGIAILTAIAFYVLRAIREHSIQREPKTEDHLDYFRELNSQGKLTEREFRIIKRQLSSRIADAAKEEREKASPPVFRPEIKDAIALLAGQQRESEETGMFGKEETEKLTMDN